MLGALKSEDALTLGARDDQGIDLATANGVQSFLGLLKAAAKFVEAEFGPMRFALSLRAPLDGEARDHLVAIGQVANQPALRLRFILN